MVDLDELERLCAAASPGPWICRKGDRDVTTGQYSDVEDAVYDGYGIGPLDTEPDEYWTWERWANDGPFIAAARTAIPALVAEIAALRAEVERLRAALDDIVVTVTSRVGCSNSMRDRVCERIRAALGPAHEGT